MLGTQWFHLILSHFSVKVVPQVFARNVKWTFKNMASLLVANFVTSLPRLSEENVTDAMIAIENMEHQR